MSEPFEGWDDWCHDEPEDDFLDDPIEEDDDDDDDD